MDIDLIAGLTITAIKSSFTLKSGLEIIPKMKKKIFEQERFIAKASEKIS